MNMHRLLESVFGGKWRVVRAKDVALAEPLKGVLDRKGWTNGNALVRDGDGNARHILKGNTTVVPNGSTVTGARLAISYDNTTADAPKDEASRPA